MSRLHRKSWDIAGSPHCLTFSCFQQKKFLSRERSANWFLESLDVARLKQAFDLWAYVIMPEHVHLVLLPGDGIKISKILQAIKLPVTRKALHWLEKNSPGFLTELTDKQPNEKTTQRFWQRGGGYDRNLRSISDVYEKIKYIHANPVRRGLVENPEDWPWSSYNSWETGIDSLIKLNRDSLPPLES
ncbi:MAG: transposase [Phycisphaerae bacterium]|nr:transposase [Phycisphaerae bacterium]